MVADQGIAGDLRPDGASDVGPEDRGIAAVPSVDPATPDGQKYCKRCGETKPTSEFWRNVQAWDGLQTYCIPCQKVAQAQSKRQSSSGLRREREAHRAAVEVLIRRHQDEYDALWARAYRGETDG